MARGPSNSVERQCRWCALTSTCSPAAVHLRASSQSRYPPCEDSVHVSSRNIYISRLGCPNDHHIAITVTPLKALEH